MDIEVTTHYLEMLSPSDLRPRRVERDGVELVQVLPAWPELNRFFYTTVGGDWYWTDRLPWTLAEWRRWLDRPELETWVLNADGLPAGYFELESQPGGDVEIAYFGLVARSIGQGLGAHLLTAAIERAWAMGASRVWVHTCSLDHPGALSNYLARGLRKYREEVNPKSLPPRPIGPWPGAMAALPLP